MTLAGWHAGVVPGEEMSDPYLAAIRRGFWLAGDLGCGRGPVHFLVGIAEGHGAAAAALDPGHGHSLRAVVTAATRVLPCTSWMRTGKLVSWCSVSAQAIGGALRAMLDHRPAEEHALALQAT